LQLRERAQARESLVEMADGILHAIRYSLLFVNISIRYKLYR
jgi:hypothetical protein